MGAAEFDRLVGEVVRELGPALVLYARTWAGSTEAEDVVQCVFVRLMLSRRWPAEPRPWLFRCVRNEAISWRRSLRRRLVREARSARSKDPIFSSGAGEGLEREEAADALAVLPGVQREIVVLRIWSGLTFGEISAVTGVAVSTVHDQYGAALATMRIRLEPSWKTAKI